MFSKSLLATFAASATGLKIETKTHTQLSVRTHPDPGYCSVPVTFTNVAQSVVRCWEDDDDYCGCAGGNKKKSDSAPGWICRAILNTALSKDEMTADELTAFRKCTVAKNIFIAQFEGATSADVASIDSKRVGDNTIVGTLANCGKVGACIKLVETRVVKDCDPSEQASKCILANFLLWQAEMGKREATSYFLEKGAAWVLLSVQAVPADFFETANEVRFYQDEDDTGTEYPSQFLIPTSKLSMVLFELEQGSVDPDLTVFGGSPLPAMLAVISYVFEPKP